MDPTCATTGIPNSPDQVAPVDAVEEVDQAS
jgi:hypothetical protein